MHLVLYTLRTKDGEAYSDPQSYADCLDEAREIWNRSHLDFREVGGIYYGDTLITSARELDLDFDEEWNYRQREMV